MHCLKDKARYLVSWAECCSVIPSYSILFHACLFLGHLLYLRTFSANVTLYTTPHVTTSAHVDTEERVHRRGEAVLLRAASDPAEAPGLESARPSASGGMVCHGLPGPFPNTCLMGTAIYATPFTPKTTPTDRHMRHTLECLGFSCVSLLVRPKMVLRDL